MPGPARWRPSLPPRGPRHALRLRSGPSRPPRARRAGLRRVAHAPRAAQHTARRPVGPTRTAACSPSPPGPPRPAEPPRHAAPPRPAGPSVPALSPGAAPNGDTSPTPARTPRPGLSFERPADGWAVETHGLTKRFGANVAVNDVDLLVPRGCAFGYLGPNGAGKTTLIRTLLGLTRADGGTMSLLGIPVPAERSQALARVGAIVDEPRFHPHLTGRAEPPPAGRGEGRRCGPADRAVAGASRPCRTSRRQGRHVLDGHAPAPRGGRRACSATRSC